MSGVVGGRLEGQCSGLGEFREPALFEELFTLVELVSQGLLLSGEQSGVVVTAAGEDTHRALDLPVVKGVGESVDALVDVVRTVEESFEADSLEPAGVGRDDLRQVEEADVDGVGQFVQGEAPGLRITGASSSEPAAGERRGVAGTGGRGGR
ncbi:hypothetical protein [Streptomyces sp. ScaeMP-e48]|uniref:hypothetical protein n=1 Tax=Streptomyces sp. ScaeMP-e48 TaxID=1100823 RepID=UPI000C0433AB|nr:hypothetical protein [Streptomyces sp. ScaeMP-e48]